MTKKEIIDEINSFNFDKNEFWISGTAALVLRGIMEEAHDIDLVITRKLFEELNERKALRYIGDNFNTDWYKLNENIDCCIGDTQKEKVEICEPFNLIDLDCFYNSFFKNSIREKDIKRKELVEKALYNKKLS